MPLYEYECEACGHRFEVIRKFSDPPLEQCTACAGPVRKLFSSPAIQFKGSGWYITDYGRKGSTSTGSSGSTGSTESGSKESGSGTADAPKASSPPADTKPSS